MLSTTHFIITAAAQTADFFSHIADAFGRSDFVNALTVTKYLLDILDASVTYKSVSAVQGIVPRRRRRSRRLSTQPTMQGQQAGDEHGSTEYDRSMQTSPAAELDYNKWEQLLCDYLAGYDPAEVPRVFLWNLRDQLVDPETLQNAIHYIWVHHAGGGLLDLSGMPKLAAELHQRLTPAEWNTLFAAAGGYFRIEQSYTGDGFGGPGCAKPTTLYRFAEDDSQTGWSWTATPANAEYFETGYGPEPRHGRLWRVDNVEPDRLLAHFHTEIKAGDPTTPQYIDEFVFEPHPDEIVPVL